MNKQKKWLTPAEAAEELRSTVKTLETWRSRQKGPPYHKVEGLVRYSRTDLEEWIQRRRVAFGAEV